MSLHSQCRYHVPFMIINHHWWTWHVGAQLVMVLCTLHDDKSPLTQPESCWHEATATSSEVYLWTLGHFCIHWYLMKAPDCLGPFPMISCLENTKLPVKCYPFAKPVSISSALWGVTFGWCVQGSCHHALFSFWSLKWKLWFCKWRLLCTSRHPTA